MAITFPRSMPRTPATAVDGFRLVERAVSFTSPVTGITQIVERPGARWEAEYSLPPMAAAEARVWTAFLTSLRGQSKTFYGFDPGKPFPALAPTGPGDGETADDTDATMDATAFTADETPLWGEPRVNGAGQTGRLLSVRGLRPNADTFKAGDHIAFENGTFRELHEVLEDVSASSAGQASFAIAPAIHRSPADGTTVMVVRAACEMRLSDPAAAGWTTDEMSLFSIRFQAIEALR